MGRKDPNRKKRAAEPDDSSFPASVLRSRWLLVIAVFAVVAFGGNSAPTSTQYGIAGAMILSNLVLAALRKRDIQLTQTLEVITIADVLVVTLAVGWVDPTPPTYLAVFAALILAMALGRVGVIMLLMGLVCAVYAGYLYTEIGAAFWRQVTLILRIPFLFAIGLHFASIASYLKKEKAERDALLATAKQHAERADHLAREQDRLRALSQIGRLALTSAGAPPVRVLLEMSHRAQKALGASRCALVVFPQNQQERTWSGRTKDQTTEVRALEVEPAALQAILIDGKLSELHPGDDKDVLARVKVFFPDSNPFGSLLVAPINTDAGLSGGLFLLDGNHKRKYSEGERDFFWTMALMTSAFIQARAKLEHELQLRTLITNAPVIMFALSKEGIVTLLEGRGAAMLRGSPQQRIGKSIFEIAGNPDETKAAFEEALAGHVGAGTLLLDGTLFETQYSPLRGIDGEISGVMGVTTAILDAPPAYQPMAAPAAAPPQPAPPAQAPATPAQQPAAPAAQPAAPAPQPAAPAAQPAAPTAQPAAPAPQPAAPAAQPAAPAAQPAAPTAQPAAPAAQPAAPAAPPAAPADDPERRRPAFPSPPADLKPTIPLADED